MTDIISAISGQFGKSFILGTLLPVALFVVLALMLALPVSQIDFALPAPLESLNAQLALTISFLTILLSGLLYNLNIPLIRLYEGYPWKDSWIGKLFTDFHKTRFVAADARWKGMRTLVYGLGENHSALKSLEDLDNITEEWRRSGECINLEYPPKASVLPTRLGNVIRSFESYPDRQYQIAAITLWPRLISKIDKDYAVVLADAKTSFDFVLNSSFLSATLALIILVGGLIYPVPLVSWTQTGIWIFKFSFFALLSYALYVLSIGRAAAWGTIVKAAFDLYRWDLLKQLGFCKPPTNRTEERQLWNDISDQVIFGDSPRVPPARYADGATFAIAEPYSAAVSVTKGATPLDKEGRMRITLAVKNDDEKRALKTLLITDTVPAQYLYAQGSLASSQIGVSITGSNPYEFHLSAVGPKVEIRIHYTIVPLGLSGPVTDRNKNEDGGDARQIEIF